VRKVPKKHVGGMQNMRIIFALPLLLATIALVPLSHASVPVPVHGTFTGGFSVVSSRLADGNTVLIIDNSIDFQGGVQGVCIDQSEFLILHPDSSDNFDASCSFNAVILGNAGTVVLMFAGNGQGLSFHGSFAINQGTGSLSGAQLQGVFAGSFTSATTFAGTITAQLL